MNEPTSWWSLQTSWSMPRSSGTPRISSVFVPMPWTRAHPREIVHPHVMVHLRHVALELGERVRGQGGDRNADGHRLQRDPHDVELLGVEAQQLGNPHAPVRRRDHEPLALEHPQRLPQWRPADVQLPGERDLGGGLARRDLTAEDR